MDLRIVTTNQKNITDSFILCVQENEKNVYLKLMNYLKEFLND